MNKPISVDQNKVASNDQGKDDGKIEVELKGENVDKT